MTIDSQTLSSILESALFTSAEPLSLDQAMSLFDEEERPDKKVLQETLQQLKEFYRDRAIELVELASGYQFQVKKEFSSWLQKRWESKPPRYSRALLETLALIAYRQPITRAEIEDIRGVAVNSQLVRTLFDHGWVRVSGYRDVPGKPALLATTKQFLDHFGLKTLGELPPLSAIQDIDAACAQFELPLEKACEEEEFSPFIIEKNEQSGPSKEVEPLEALHSDEQSEKTEEMESSETPHGDEKLEEVELTHAPNPLETS
jgi:segregation and condensation protein B